MRKRGILLFAFFCLMLVQGAFAQMFVVKGTVTTSEDGSPLLQAGVMQKGTTNGVVTDFDGNYTIEIRDVKEATLVFTYVGHETQEFVVNAGTKELNVELPCETQLIDDVVVVAYGVRKKGTIAGSVTTVKAEKIENVPTAGFDQALQGQPILQHASPARITNNKRFFSLTICCIKHLTQLYLIYR